MGYGEREVVVRYFTTTIVTTMEVEWGYGVGVAVICYFTTTIESARCKASGGGAGNRILDTSLSRCHRRPLYP